MDFVYELESRTELMNVVKITETLGGRDVVMAILSNPPVFQKADLAYSDKAGGAHRQQRSWRRNSR